MHSINTWRWQQAQCQEEGCAQSCIKNARATDGEDCAHISRVITHCVFSCASSDMHQLKICDHTGYIWIIMFVFKANAMQYIRRKINSVTGDRIQISGSEKLQCWTKSLIAGCVDGALKIWCGQPLICALMHNVNKTHIVSFFIVPENAILALYSMDSK